MFQSSPRHHLGPETARHRPGGHRQRQRHRQLVLFQGIGAVLWRARRSFFKGDGGFDGLRHFVWEKYGKMWFEHVWELFSVLSQWFWLIVMSSPDECQPWLVNCGGSPQNNSNYSATEIVFPSKKQPFGCIYRGLILYGNHIPVGRKKDSGEWMIVILPRYPFFTMGFHMFTLSWRKTSPRFGAGNELEQ